MRRRDFLKLSAGAPLIGLAACNRAPQSPSSPRVTVATSTDDFLARPIAKLCEETTGVAIDLITDTEATKAIALVQKVRSEGSRVDVWWSSEVLTTLQLARDGLLSAWPGEANVLWREFASRARVIAYHTGRIKGDPPRKLRELTDSRWKGQVAIARPQFGSTRGHIAGLIALHGEPRVRAWLMALRANDVRVVEGNSAVVRAIAQGEATLGLTDSDDVWVGLNNLWPVACVQESADESPCPPDQLPAAGTFLFPNTVGVLASAPHPDAAWKVAQFLCSPACEQALAKSLSRNIPHDAATREALAKRDPWVLVPEPIAKIDWSAMLPTGGALEQCDALLRDVFPI